MYNLLIGGDSMKKIIKIISAILVITFVVQSTFIISANAEEYVCPKCGTTDCGMTIGELVVSATCIHPNYYHINCGTRGDFAWLAIGDVNPDCHEAEQMIKHVDTTCTEEGYDLYYCSACGKETKINECPPFHPSGHDYVADKNCESAYTEYYCSICSSYYTEPKAPTEHKYRAVSTDCTKNYTDYECSVCEYTKRETKAKTSHVWNKWETDVAPTCTKEGTASRTCTLCTVGREEKVLQKTAHCWTDWAVIQAPTETKAGQKIRTCTVCKNNETDIIPAGTVSEYIKNISVADITLNYKDTATISPEIEATYGTIKTIEYSSSSSAVASINSTGVLTAHKPGSAVITVIATDKNGFQAKDTFTVTVKYTWWQWMIRILLLGFLWY